jgi:hypothetical protein
MEKQINCQDVGMDTYLMAYLMTGPLCTVGLSQRQPQRASVVEQHNEMHERQSSETPALLAESMNPYHAWKRPLIPLALPR